MSQIALWGMGLSALVSVSSQASSDVRERQWRLLAPDRGSGAAAVFMSWDGTSRIFTVTCDSQSKELVVRYSLPDVVGLKLNGPMSIGLVVLRTLRKGEVLEGRSKLTPKLERALKAPGDLLIDAPNEIGEPWYVGHAGPLRGVALACR